MNTRPADLVKLATEVLAGLAAALAFVYLVGAGVLWVRLYQTGLPTEAVITSLPRELLLSVGLRSIFLPALFFGALAVGALLLISRSERADRATRVLGSETSDRSEDTRAVLRILIGSWGVLASISLVVIFVLLWAVGPGPLWAFGWIIGGILVLLATAFISANFEVGSLRATALIAVLIGLAATMARFVVEFYNPQFVDTAVCVNDSGDPYTGLLIGETDRGIYLGIDTDGEERVLEVPRDRLSEMRIGTDDVTDCPTSTPQSTAP